MNCCVGASQRQTREPSGRFGRRSDNSCDCVRSGIETIEIPADKGSITVVVSGGFRRPSAARCREVDDVCSIAPRDAPTLTGKGGAGGPAAANKADPTNENANAKADAGDFMLVTSPSAFEGMTRIAKTFPDLFLFLRLGHLQRLGHRRGDIALHVVDLAKRDTTFEFPGVARAIDADVVHARADDEPHHAAAVVECPS